MFLWPVFQYIKDNRWAQVALIIAASIATLGIYLAIRDEGVKQRERARQEVERARERARIAETRRQIQQETSNARQRADEAVSNLPEFNSADELRARDPALAAIVFGTDPRGDKPAEGR
jgi:hypothetical protein